MIQNITLSQSQKKKLIDELLINIKNLNYHIVNRADLKNKLFMSKYRIINEKGTQIILEKISINNLISVEYDDDVIQYGTEEVVIFHIDCKLTDYHGDDNEVKVYVKIKNKKDNIPIISLHECDY